MEAAKPDLSVPSTWSVWHSFHMTRSNHRRGFKTKEYRIAYNKPVEHFDLADENHQVSIEKRLASLYKIKRHFCTSPYYLACVVEGHLTNPATLIQLIVVCSSQNELDRISDWIAYKPRYLCWTYHLKYEWLSDVPREVMLEWGSAQ